MRYEDLTEEQKAKVQACKTPEDLLSLAKEEGVMLSDEDLERISGGDAWGLVTLNATCVACGKTAYWPSNQPTPVYCPYCGARFNLE